MGVNRSSGTQVAFKDVHSINLESSNITNFRSFEHEANVL